MDDESGPPYELMTLLRQRGIAFRYQLPNDGGEIRCTADGTVSVAPVPVHIEGLGG